MLATHQIHPKCKPLTGREHVAQVRDQMLAETPWGGLSWVGAYESFLSCKCGVCGEVFKPGEPVTVLRATVLRS